MSLAIEEKEVAYSFRSGFQQESERLYRWLNLYGLKPSFDVGQDAEGACVTLILLPAEQIPSLHLMQQKNPARFGNPPESAE